MTKRYPHGRSKPAEPMEASWKPDMDYGREKFGFTEKELWKEAERFRNHAASTGRQLSDWNAGWRNWVIKAAEFNGKDMKVDTQDCESAVASQRYYFKREDPRFQAWLKYTGKKSYPLVNGGWWFDDEWPPGVNPFL